MAAVADRGGKPAASVGRPGRRHRGFGGRTRGLRREAKRRAGADPAAIFYASPPPRSANAPPLGAPWLVDVVAAETAAAAPASAPTDRSAVGGGYGAETGVAGPLAAWRRFVRWRALPTTRWAAHRRAARLGSDWFRYARDAPADDAT